MLPRVPDGAEARRAFRVRRRRAIAIAAMLGTLLAGGCASIQIRAGNPVDVSVLEGRLQPGRSTHAEVREALGPAFGEGKEWLPLTREPRDTWSYYYEEGSLEDDRRLFLFVFFREGRYDGYMWFSSLLPPGAPGTGEAKPAPR